MNMTQGATAMESGGEARRQVYVIDDDGDVRRSLHFLLAASAIVAWPFGEAADFLDALPTLAPAPILLDIRMPRIDGFELLQALEQRGIRWPVVVMTAHGDVPIAVRAMKLGATEFLEKPFPPGALDRALNHCFNLLDQAAATQSSHDRARHLLELLSPREREIVDILVEGVPNKVVAHRLGLSTRTVEMHRSNALAKLTVKSVPEVLAMMRAADPLP